MLPIRGLSWLRESTARTWAGRILAMGLVSGGALVIAAPEAGACLCVAQTPAEAWAGSDVILTGKVVDRVSTKDRVAVWIPEPDVYTLEVQTVHKGTAHAQTFVHTSPQESACGLPALTLGQPATLYTRKHPSGRLVTTLCDAPSTTTPAGRADLARLLATGTPPTPGEGPGRPSDAALIEPATDPGQAEPAAWPSWPELAIGLGPAVVLVMIGARRRDPRPRTTTDSRH